MTTTAATLADTSGSIEIPEHLLLAIREACAWNIACAGGDIERPAHLNNWAEFEEQLRVLEQRIAMMRGLGMPGDDPRSVDAASLAPIVREAADDAYHDLRAMTEQGERARSVVAQATVVADLDAFADRLESEARA